MRNSSSIVLAVAMFLSFGLDRARAEGLDEISVAYFLEWPLPFLAAKAAGTYDTTLGVKVNWVSFETGTAMSEALASGEIQLAVSQGLPPFVAAVSEGKDLQIVDVAASYTEHENCVVRSDLGIDKGNAAELAGKKVSVPLGTAAHYSFLRQMEHFGVDPNDLQIVDMSPPEGAVALSHGAVDLACGYGGGLARMLEHGNVLLTGPEKAEVGIRIFDVTSAPTAFVTAHPELVARFVQVTAEANAAWVSEQGEDMIAILAAQSGMSPEIARASLALFDFPTVDAQLSNEWLGESASDTMKNMADAFADAGYIDSALPSYVHVINTKPLQNASEF